MGDTDSQRELHKLSPDKVSQLQAAIVEDFGSWFAPGAKVLYQGDKSRKIRIFEENIFARLGIEVSGYAILPDIVLYHEEKNWLFLIEIAWESEVWIAEIPSHMIHFNGEKFLRPKH